MEVPTLNTVSNKAKFKKKILQNYHKVSTLTNPVKEFKIM